MNNPTQLQEFSNRLNLTGFTNIEKGISEQEFHENYVINSNFEIYSEKQLSEFYKGATDELQKGLINIEGLEEINNSLASLQQVKLSKGEGGEYINVYVRPKQISTDNDTVIEKAVEDDIEKGGNLHKETITDKNGHQKTVMKKNDESKKVKSVNHHNAFHKKIQGEELDEDTSKETFGEDMHKEILSHLNSDGSDLHQQNSDGDNEDYEDNVDHYGKDSKVIKRIDKDGYKAELLEHKSGKRFANVQEDSGRGPTMTLYAHGKIKKGFEEDVDDNLEKGAVTDSFGSYNASKITFKKTGKEIKIQMEKILIPMLAAQKITLAVELLSVKKDCGEGCEPTQPLSQYMYKGFGAILPAMMTFSYVECSQLYDDINRKYNDPTDEQVARSKYNQLVSDLVGTSADIEYCNMMIRNLSDSDKIELTADQVLSLQF